MAKHIGIVAVSPEGSALCYREIAQRASHIKARADRPLITLHNIPFANYLEAIQAGDWESVGQMLCWSADTLAAAGADFCILPDNAAHHAIQFAEAGSPIPWINMIDVVAKVVCDEHRRTVGILGTKLVMRGSIYQTVLGMHGVIVHAPDEDDSEAIDHIIFSELVEGDVLQESRLLMLSAIDKLASQGCEGVILGSTETPLLFASERPSLPTYDPVGLLVDEAIRQSIQSA